MKAIILAAGVGSRLKEVCDDRPKPLFEIRGKSLLEHSLDALAKAGIKEIIVVVGYKGEMIKEEIGEEYNGVKIGYAENELYETTGSMHSLYSAFRRREPEDCLLLDADLVYDPKIIANLVNHEKKDAAFLVNPCGSGDETFTVLDESGRMVHLRLKKNEDLRFLEGKKVFEFNGISKLSKEFVNRMISLHETKIKENNKFDSYYEECALEVNKEIPWFGLVDEGFVLAEIDRKEDIKRAEILLDKI